MCDRVFKTPTALYHKGTSSDSDSSVSSEKSTQSNGAASSNGGEISIVAEFDDLMRVHKQIRSDKLLVECSFLDFIEQTKTLYKEYCSAVEECRRLQTCLDGKVHECSDLELKLTKARKLLDQEKGHTRNAKKERDDLVS